MELSTSYFPLEAVLGPCLLAANKLRVAFCLLLVRRRSVPPPRLTSCVSLGQLNHAGGVINQSSGQGAGSLPYLPLGVVQVNTVFLSHVL